MAHYIIISFMLFVGIGSHTDADVDAHVLLSTKEVEIQLESESVMELFLEADYDRDAHNLVLETVGNIKSLLIYTDSGDLEFMLPVMSNRVILGRNMFGSGRYRIGFSFQYHHRLTFADVYMK